MTELVCTIVDTIQITSGGARIQLCVVNTGDDDVALNGLMLMCDGEDVAECVRVQTYGDWGGVLRDGDALERRVLRLEDMVDALRCGVQKPGWPLLWPRMLQPGEAIVGTVVADVRARDSYEGNWTVRAVCEGPAGEPDAKG
jgi:hypothetical protein